MVGLIDQCKKYFGTGDLYELLGISKGASDDEVKKAYRKLSLIVHPDRVPEEKKEESTEKFKVLGKVHCILGDANRRNCYDETGCIDDEECDDLQNRDWNEYWRHLFKNVTEDDIIQYEKTYKDGEEERRDLIKAYNQGKGDIDHILDHVPFSSPDEVPRLKGIIQSLIDNGELTMYEKFANDTPRKQEARKRKFEREAKEAEKLAKLNKRSKVPVETDALAAIILKKKEREAQADSFFKHLEEKYSRKGRKAK